MHQRAGLAVRPQPLHLVGNADHAATPRLDINKVCTLANVGKRVAFAAVVCRFAAV